MWEDGKIKSLIGGLDRKTLVRGLQTKEALAAGVTHNKINDLVSHFLFILIGLYHKGAFINDVTRARGSGVRAFVTPGINVDIVKWINPFYP